MSSLLYIGRYFVLLTPAQTTTDYYCPVEYPVSGSLWCWNNICFMYVNIVCVYISYIPLYLHTHIFSLYIFFHKWRQICFHTLISMSINVGLYWLDFPQSVREKNSLKCNLILWKLLLRYLQSLLYVQHSLSCWKLKKGTIWESLSQIS